MIVKVRKVNIYLEDEAFVHSIATEVSAWAQHILVAPLEFVDIADLGNHHSRPYFRRPILERGMSLENYSILAMVLMLVLSFSFLLQLQLIE